MDGSLSKGGGQRRRAGRMVAGRSGHGIAAVTSNENAAVSVLVIIRGLRQFRERGGQCGRPHRRRHNRPNVTGVSATGAGVL